MLRGLGTVQAFSSSPLFPVEALDQPCCLFLQPQLQCQRTLAKSLQRPGRIISNTAICAHCCR